MITMLNQDTNFDKYTVLFRNAWKDLLDRNALEDADKDAAEKGKIAFADLAHYFAYIKDLITIDPTYVMLPIDEAPFEINANTRTIKVPPSFRTCSGVQSDNYAEIVTFTVDRYFDYKDLDQASIAVQWINDAAQTEGVSFIQLKDLKTYGDENKIRFGWPLTSEMTAAAGNLRFAVRFYTAQTNDEGKIEFNYLLNTIPESIPIKDTLKIDWNSTDTVKKDNDLALFTSYITNSSNPSYGIPTSIEFVLEDNEFPQYGQIDLGTDTLVLKAQGITKDLNPLAYEWYRKKDDVIVKIDPSTEEHSGKFSISSEPVLYDPEPEKWPKERPIMTFWVPKEAPLTGYTPFLEAWPTEKPDYDLYLMKTSLTFLADGGDDVTGEYFVKAINQVTDKNGKVVNSVDATSRVCVILTPAPVTIVKDLPVYMFLDDKSNTLTFEISEDKHAQRSYEVYYKNENSYSDPAEINEKIAGAQFSGTKIDYTIEDFGLYKIKVISELNRDDESVESMVCYVSDHPGNIQGIMSVDGLPIDTSANWGTISAEKKLEFEWIEDEEGATLEYNAVKLHADAITTIELSVLASIENKTKYNEGTINYRWTRTLEGVEEDITKPTGPQGDIVAIDLKTGVLKIQIIAPETGGYTYTCYITNTIANETTEPKTFSFTIV